MTHANPPVKAPRDRIYVVVVNRCISWIDRHPRIGWYLAALVVLNYIIDAAQSGLL